MSFSSEVKKELTNIVVRKPENIRSELAAFLRITGTVHLGFDSSLEVQTQNPAIARRVHLLLSQLYGIDLSTQIANKIGKNKYSIFIEDYQLILRDLNIDPLAGDLLVPERLVETADSMHSFLRGLFLAGGSVNQPNSSNYHLELKINEDNLAEQVKEFIRLDSLEAKLLIRKNNNIVYLKKADQIADFLTMIGATTSMLKFEDVRIMRDMRNSVNRLVNVESANLDRTIAASEQQIENINIIDNTIGLKNLPENLQEIARLRIEHPDLKLSELGELVSNGPLSKSGVNHRLRKLMEYL